MSEDVRFAYFGAYGDPAAWRTFAGEVHGLQPVELDGKLCFRMDERLWRIAIEPGQTRGCAYIGLEADDHMFDAILGRLRAGAVDVEIDQALADVRRVRRLARFTGPGGVAFELVTGAMSADSPFVSPLGSEFVTGAAGMGHFALSVPDLDAAQSFFRDIMGFRLTDSIVNDLEPGQNTPSRSHFYRGGRRHHTVALLTIPGITGVHHVFIEGASLMAVGRAWDRIAAGAAPVMMTLGQHLNDPAISYYCVCPGRFGFEYGWDSTLIHDDAAWEPKLWNNGFTWGHHFQKPKPKAEVAT